MNPAKKSARRILYVEGNRDGTIGGSYFSLLFLASGLDRARFDPMVVFARENELLQRFRKNKIRTIILPTPEPIRWPSSFGRVCSRVLNFLSAVVWRPLYLAILLRRERVSLVHLNNSIRRNHSWIIGAWLAHIPCITHERGINEHFQRRDRILAHRLRTIICISDAVKQNFFVHGLGDLHLVTIHNGLDPAEMRVTRGANEIRAELGISADRRLIGIVGNIKPWKGQETVIRAMAQLSKDFPEVICLLIGDTPDDELHYRHELEDLIDQLDLDENILITGFRYDVANYVNTLEILVHASVLPEPFGRVLLEGMALGKPLVASNAGGVREIVVDGVTGLLFEPKKPDALAYCLKTLLNDPIRRHALGKAGRERLEMKFSITYNLARTQALYETLFGD